MAVTMENNQSQQENKKQGGLGQGTINTINNFPLRGFGRPFLGQRVATGVALRGATGFFAANPWFWGILGIILLIVIFTAGIVGFGGFPASEQNNQTPASEQQ